MKRTAVVTVAIGDVYQRLADVTHPTFESYARRIGADFISLTKHLGGRPHFAKLQCFDILGTYDRMIFVDTDTVIAGDCPNLFSLVPEDNFGAYLVSEHTALHDDAIMFIQGQLRDLGWSREYFNSGVLVASRKHRAVFDSDDADFVAWARACEGRRESETYSDQTYLNYKVQENSFSITDIGYRFNHSLAPRNSQLRFGSHIIHCKGHMKGSKLSEVKRARFVFDRPLIRWALASSPMLTNLSDRMI